MATDKKKTSSKKNNKGGTLRSVAWLLEASFRVFVGWALLSNFENFIVTAAAFYALGTGAVIVGMHFFNAHK